MKHVLIIDGQPCVRALLRAQLTLEGYGVTDVGDMDSARKYLSSSTQDLVITDVFLDEEEGFSLLPDIKRRQPQVPVIILTAYDSFRNDSRLALADAYVIKSLDFTGLRKTIRNLLSHQLIDEPAQDECWASAV